jgi:hypothetical protein
VCIAVRVWRWWRRRSGAATERNDTAAGCPSNPAARTYDTGACADTQSNASTNTGANANANAESPVAYTCAEPNSRAAAVGDLDSWRQLALSR